MVTNAEFNWPVQGEAPLPGLGMREMRIGDLAFVEIKADGSKSLLCGSGEDYAWGKFLA
jgi:hypothetical protein